MQIDFPLFVRAKDSGEITAFNSVCELQAEVEKIDIENEEYEAWDKDGLPIRLALQDPAIWIRLEPSGSTRSPDQLRQALLDFAKSVGVQLQDQLPVDAFESSLKKIRLEHEKQMLAKSPIRRFLARFRRPTLS